MKTALLILLSTIISSGALTGQLQKKRIESNNIHKEYKDTVLQSKYSTVIMGRFTENDTTFFLKEYDNEDGRQYLNTVIYIEPDKNSINYKDISQPIFKPERGQYDLDGWRRYKQRKQMPPLSKVDLLDLPTDWVPLHSYQNHYYVFRPCETDIPLRRCLTDTMLVYYTGEYLFNAIHKFEKQSKSLYFIELKNLGEDSQTTPTQIYIHIIDSRRKVAVWEYRKENKSEYELMIPIESAKYFDMIVCSSSIHKFFNEELFKFDEIDFKTLLKQKKL